MRLYVLFLTTAFQIQLHVRADATSGGSGSITVCGNRQCQNNALCDTDGQSCQCRRGYAGELCEEDTDECSTYSTDPCFHRGKCFNTFGSWLCICLQGWISTDPTQQHCNKPTSPDIKYRKCMPGWMGEWCRDECVTDDQCSKNHVCQKRGKGLLCVCDFGWTGSNCTTDLDECTRNPCKSFQTCVNSDGLFACTCPTGWKGSTCSEDVDECVSRPCKHSGTCLNTNGSYICNCNEGWKGDNCEVDTGGVDKKSVSLGIMLGSVIWAPALAVSVICTAVIVKHKCGRNRTEVQPEVDTQKPSVQNNDENIYFWDKKH